MELLFVSPGLSPHDDAPGAPEVSGALPKALKALGHRVTLIAPLPEGFDVTTTGFSRRLSGVEVTEPGGDAIRVDVFDGRSMGGTQLIFLDHPRLADLLAEGSAGLAAQWLFAQAVDRLVAAEPSFDLAHVHDEVTALASLALSRAGRMPVIFTIYDSFAQDFPAADGRALGLDVEEDRYCPTAAAILAAHFVTTTSPARVARALQQPSSAVGRALKKRRAHVAGVLNGIDVSVYNPVTDPLLVARYSPYEPLAKARNKTMLQRELGLDIDADVPLLGAVENEVGATRLLPALRELLRNDVQVALQLLDDEAACADPLIALSERYPERFQLRLGDAPARTHALLAGCDILVLTGDEPTLAMAAHRYGTIPVTASDTSAAEHCVDLDAKLETGDAVVFDPRKPDALLDAMRRAAAAFNRGARFDRLRTRVMRIDHSYERTARTYDSIYNTLLERQAAE